MSKVTQRAGGQGPGVETGPRPPPSRSSNPGPGGQLHSPAAPEPFPASGRGPDGRTSPGPPRLLGTPRHRLHNQHGLRAGAPGARRRAPVTELSPEHPRSFGGSAPRSRPLPAPPPRATLARARLISVSAPLPHPGLAPGAGRRGLELRLPLAFPIRGPQPQKGSLLPPRRPRIDKCP